METPKRHESERLTKAEQGHEGSVSVTPREGIGEENND